MKPRRPAPPNPVIRAAFEILRKGEKAAKKEAEPAAPVKKPAAKKPTPKGRKK